MIRHLLVLAFFFIGGPGLHAGTIAIDPPDLPLVIRMIAKTAALTRQGNDAAVNIQPDTVSFISVTPLNADKKPAANDRPRSAKDDFFKAETTFLLKSDTIIKDIHISQGEEEARLRLKLDHRGRKFANFLYHGTDRPIQVYNRDEDMVIYAQTKDTGGGVELHEWTYARKPNCFQGSCYRWKISSMEFYRRIVLAPSKDGQVDITRQTIVQGINANDYQKQRHAVDVTYKLLGKAKVHISGEDVIAKVPPVYYVTREGKRGMARIVIHGHDELEMVINEPAKNYPLFIESS